MTSHKVPKTAKKTQPWTLWELLRKLNICNIPGRQITIWVGIFTPRIPFSRLCLAALRALSSRGLKLSMCVGWREESDYRRMLNLRTTSGEVFVLCISCFFLSCWSNQMKPRIHYADPDSASLCGLDLNICIHPLRIKLYVLAKSGCGAAKWFARPPASWVWISVLVQIDPNTKKIFI
jgi:hypothetical protein